MESKIVTVCDPFDVNNFSLSFQLFISYAETSSVGTFYNFYLKNNFKFFLFGYFYFLDFSAKSPK